MKTYVSDTWKESLQEQGVTGIDDWWRLRLPPIDRVNRERGGWSSVALFRLHRQGAGLQQVVVKRQENHNSRTVFHPFRGIPTFEKELKNIFLFQRKRIPTVVPVYFAKEQTRHRVRSVLVTEFLEGYRSLEDLLAREPENRSKNPDVRKRRRLIENVARAVRGLHEHKILHNCLYPKHLFISQRVDADEVCFIDLEKCKWKPFGRRFRIRDLNSLHRRTTQVRNTERLRFLRAYLQADDYNRRWKQVCRKIIRHKQ